VPSLLLHYLGGLMPALVAVGLLYAQRVPQVRRDFWQRAVDFRRIGPTWYAVTLFTAPLLTALAVLLAAVLGAGGGEWEAAAQFVRQPLAILPFALFTLLFGPIPEELGWRGYALDGLQVRRNALASSLILGTVWTFWHLPLFFIEGTYQHGLGMGSVAFWLYMMDKVPQSILMTWIYNNNRRSTLSAILFHFAVNFAGELYALSRTAEIVYIALWILAALTVTILWGPKRLARERAGRQLQQGDTTCV
jgi:membrane protease YdiL (CAAX protease family)